jgi:hypothetical protein
LETSIQLEQASGHRHLRQFRFAGFGNLIVAQIHKVK